MDLETLLCRADKKGISRESLSTLVQNRYKQLLKNGSVKDFQALAKLADIKPELSEGFIQETYAAYLCKDLIDKYKYLLEITKVPLAEKTVENVYHSLLASASKGNLNVELVKKIIDLTGKKHSEEEAQVALGGLARNKCFNLLISLKGVLGIEPADWISKEVYQKSITDYRGSPASVLESVQINSDDSSLEMLSDIIASTGVKPPKTGVEIIFYNIIVTTGMMERISKIEEITGHKLSDAENLQIIYDSLLSKNYYERIKQVIELSGKKPTEAQVIGKMNSLAKTGSLTKITLLSEITGVEPENGVYDSLLDGIIEENQNEKSASVNNK